MKYLLPLTYCLVLVQGRPSILDRKIRKAVQLGIQKERANLLAEMQAMQAEFEKELYEKLGLGDQSATENYPTVTPPTDQLSPFQSNATLNAFKKDIVDECVEKIVGDETYQPPTDPVNDGGPVPNNKIDIRTSNDIDMVKLTNRVYNSKISAPKGKKRKVAVKYVVECTSEGIQSIEFKKHTKIMTKNFKKTYNDNQNSITDSISNAKYNSDKLAERILSIRDTEDVSDNSYAVSVSTSASGGTPLYSMSGSASFAFGMNQFRSNKKMTHDEKEKLVDTAKASSMSKLMSTQVGEINSLVNSMEGHNETMVYKKTVFQEGRFQLWRRVKKWFQIDGDNLYEEKFQYIHDSPDEITRQERKQCATDYLNDVVLSGTGFKTDEQTLEFYSVITDPDFQENAKRSMVVMWAGSVKDIPKGWLLCDGTLGTPDLRDKFVLGASEDIPVDSEGGNHTRVLTVDQLPSHDHGMETGGHNIRGMYQRRVHYLANTEDGHYKCNDHSCITVPGGYIHYVTKTQSFRKTSTHPMYKSGEHIHTIKKTGNNKPIDIKPKYYSLAFIMKA